MIISEWVIIAWALITCGALFFYYSRRGGRRMRSVWMWLILPCINTVYTYYRIATEKAMPIEITRFLGRLTFMDFLVTITVITVVLGLTNVKRHR